MLQTLIVAAALTTSPEEANLTKMIPEIIEKSASHYKALDNAATPLMKKGRGCLVPRGYRRAKGAIDMRSVFEWTSGHYAGSLWYLYEATRDVFFKDRAIAWTEILAPNAKVTDNHDVGFIMYCSYGNARRLLKTDRYDAILCKTAESLCKRYNDKVGLIRSWGKINEKRNYFVIPDNLMNLELLEFAAQANGKDGKFVPVVDFDRIVRSHADKTMKNHYRPDGGCYHVLNYDQETGLLKYVMPGQGKSRNTAWARGQSWSIYGYTMLYRTTKDARYLDFAKKLADYAINHPNMPDDGVPFWDYGAPGEERDTSAAAIMASALVELSQFAGDADCARYRAFAVKQLLSLSSSEYFSEGDEIGHFLLKHGVGNKPRGSEVDVPLNYGDYYFLEALVRFRNMRKDNKEYL